MGDVDQIISGWLHKRGGVDASKAWRRRWCVLGHQALHYYKAEQDKEPTGSVYAEDMVGVSQNADESSKDPKYAFVFEINTGDRTFVFCANSQEEQDEWMANLRRMLSRDDRISDQDGFHGQLLEYTTVEVFHDKGIRVNGPLSQDSLTQLGQGATSKQKRMDERGWYVEIFVSMHRVIEVISGHGWRLDQVYQTHGLLPGTGPSACNMLIFSRPMSYALGGRPIMQFMDSGGDEESLLARGYSPAATTSTGRRNTGEVTIGPDGAIVREKIITQPVIDEE
ncbi:uncharacterized protein LOC135826596 [Sycon ciliatum]|uniref:uncharacterized protein LOC135826596 n=1 Tax=Sycon ciliatum TaxID=27933 RepID=UPI0031F71586